MKVIVITSNHLRHMAYAKMLCDRTEVSKVFIEEKPASSRSGSLQLREREYFASVSGWLPDNFTSCKKGEINSPRMEEEIRREKPDIIFVFGSSLLKENIFSIDKSIDAGDIILQARPCNLSTTDDLEDVFLKNCICGFDLVCDNLGDLLGGDIKTTHLSNRGTLYQMKDKTPAKIREVEKKLIKVLGDYCG